jgi:hypothetical protein
MLAHATTSVVATGLTKGHPDAVSFVPTTTVANTDAGTAAIGIVNLGTSTAKGWIAANIQGGITVAASTVVEIIGGAANGYLLAGGSSTVDISSALASAADSDGA